MYWSESDLAWCRNNLPENTWGTVQAHEHLCANKRMHDIALQLCDMSDVVWSVQKESSGTDGVFLKHQQYIGGVEHFWKLSSFSDDKGFYGHECALEIIAQRVIDWCGIEHAVYRLIPVKVIIEGMHYITFAVCSKDYRRPGEHRISIKQYCTLEERVKDRTEYLLSGPFKRFFIESFLVDYILYNRDRHGRNLEVLYSSVSDGYRMAPLFDHGCCLTQRLFDDWQEKDSNYYLINSLVSSYVGTHSLYKNLITYCPGNIHLPHDYLPEDLLRGLDLVLGKEHCDFLWNMLNARHNHALEILSSR